MIDALNTENSLYISEYINSYLYGYDNIFYIRLSNYVI